MKWLCLGVAILSVSLAVAAEQTADPVVGAGANLLVTGSAVFGSGDPGAAYAAIVAAAQAL